MAKNFCSLYMDLEEAHILKAILKNSILSDNYGDKEFDEAVKVYTDLVKEIDELEEQERTASCIQDNVEDDF